MGLSKYSLRCLLFSKSRVEPPKMGMIISKVGNAECWLFVIWFSSFSGGPGVGVVALVLAELEWWVDSVVFEGLAAAASCGCSCS